MCPSVSLIPPIIIAVSVVLMKTQFLSNNARDPLSYTTSLQ